MKKSDGLLQMQIVILRLSNLGTRPQKQSSPRLSGNREFDRSCTVYVNEQHRYGFTLQRYGHANL